MRQANREKRADLLDLRAAHRLATQVGVAASAGRGVGPLHCGKIKAYENVEC